MSTNAKVYWACEMNPGCLQFMTDLSHISYRHLDLVVNVIAMWPSLRGSKAYMIWNDACGRDTHAAYRIFEAILDKRLSMKVVLEHLEGVRCAPFKPEEYEGGAKA